MKHFAIVIVVALLAIALLLFLYNPGILEDVWLWIVGLIGVIISAIKNAIEGLKNLFKSDQQEVTSTKQAETVKTASQSQPDLAIITQANEEYRKSISEYKTRINDLESQINVLESKLSSTLPKDEFNGTTLSVIRYFDDGETTLGLLFIDNKYFCYTLEDTYREVKVKGKTRIPKGTYNLDFNRFDTGLTLKYRKTRPWFTYHLHVQNVPGYEGIYIHSGSTHEHTEGCLLVARSIYSDDAKSSIFNSKVTFEALYKQLQTKLDTGERLRIIYYDEDFMNYSLLNNKAS